MPMTKSPLRRQTLERNAVACAVWAAVCLFATPLLAAPCESLASLSFKDAKITSAQIVPSGQFLAPGQQSAGARNPYKELPAFCRVAATLTPSSDSDIKVEVWLPTANWNGKFQ